jgi:hypothetical protein
MTAPRSREGLTLSSLDQLLAGEGAGSEKPNITAAIRKIGANKDLRIFLTAICKYSKADWASYGRAFKILYSVMQSSLLIKDDSVLMNEVTSIPHIAVFFKRLTDSDI